MKILLAAKHAPYGKRPIGGVQSWCRTVAGELSKRGHFARTWGPEQPLPTGRYDVGIIANLGDTHKALFLCDKVINVCHGIIPAERPGGDSGLGSMVNVFTSEEVRDRWNCEGTIIRQPIDLDFWSPAQSSRLYLTRFSYRSGLSFVPALAMRLGFRYYHLRNSNAEGVRSVLRKSAIVLASGRAALEAMACEVPVVICDDRSAYQDPLLDVDVFGAMTRNYSGRGGVTPTTDNVTQAIETAMASVRSYRAHVEEHHDVRNIVDQLLEQVA